MSVHRDNTVARERVLVVAEQLFARRGYTGVTLRDIADAVGIKHTSLYHHVPGGKEQLFIEVTERSFRRHREGLTRVVAQAPADLRGRLHAVADWLLSQPPMDLVRMVYTDMPAIAPAHAARLSSAAYEAMLSPIEAALRHAQQNGEIEHHALPLIAGGLLGMIESLYAVPTDAINGSRETMAYVLIDALLTGLYPRERKDAPR